ncbi:MAG: ABC transporter ATP-binding protein [Eubacteriales bacterium]|nr:ABC transporter ATP-binding protein [Eubacteriales bacterium]
MIDIQSVSYSYQEDGTDQSLKNIDLKIQDGECVLLCGKSGCGKTTITRLLNGMIPNFYEGAVTGKVMLDGDNLLDLPMFEISKKVGTVFQNPRTQFYTVNTTSEIAFGCENLGMPPEEIADRVRQTAKDLQIEFLLNRNIFALSGGEKQIVAFASIYAMSPQIYVLDEPSSNLDVQAIEKIRKILTLLKQQGKTIVIAEHRTYYLKDLVDRAVYLDNGKIVREYSMSELAHFTVAEQLERGIRTVDLLNYPVKPYTAPATCGSIRIDHLRFSYGKDETLHIDHMEIPSGHITAIIGTNGAGKSTFVSCLCGLLKKTKGNFVLSEKPFRTKDRLRQSYLVMQEVNHQLFSDSVQEEIVLGVKEQSDSQLKTITDALDITALYDRHPMTLSGGQKQRVIIASAMFCGKRILFFDEPTSGLDFSHMMHTCELLKGLQKKDTFLFIITHDFEFIASVCDSVIHIEQGKVIEQYDLNQEGVEKSENFFKQSMREKHEDT